ncbi:MAG: hypothetical protein WC614_03700 [bacterium]
MKNKYSPYLEIGIFLSACLLVFLLAYPQYKEKIEIKQRYMITVSAYSLQAAVENYAAYNNGRFPKDLSEIEKFYTPPVNSYTQKPITTSDIQVFEYDLRTETSNFSSDGQNASLKGMIGGLAYGYYIAPADSFPSSYGIVGFDNTGKPLADKLPSGEIKVFVLNSEE